MALSKAEQQELKELEELEKLEALEARSQNFAPTTEEMAEYKAGKVPERFKGQVEPFEGPTTGEAMAAGWVQGVPFLKDGVAAADGIADAMEEDGASFDTAYSNYKENLDEIKNMEKLNIKFGFSNYALNNLNNIVYIEFYKDIDDTIDKDDIVGNVESVKASIDIIPYLNGTLKSLNQEFIDTIQEHSEATIDNIQEMSDYNEENGLSMLELEVDNNEINNIIELIDNNELMNEEEYEKFLDK